MYGLGDEIRDLTEENIRLKSENERLRAQILDLTNKIEIAIKAIKRMTELAQALA